MNELRDRFLTETMGECWHEDVWATSSDDGDGSVSGWQCKHHQSMCYSSNRWSEGNKSFSTWEGFGKLYEWARKQEWWNQFAGNTLGEWSYDGKTVYISENVIDPDKFSDALYGWGIHWFEYFGIVNRHKGTYEI